MVELKPQDQLLLKEFEEINSHTRHTVHLYVYGYAFTIAGNVVAVGWFASIPLGTFVGLFNIVVAVFVLLDLVAVLVCHRLVRYINAADLRVGEILSQISALVEGHPAAAKSPIPKEIYCYGTRASGVAMFVLTVAWVLFYYWRNGAA